MKVLQIADSVNWGSIGKIASQIGDTILEQGGESYIAYGRYQLPSSSQSIRIGTKVELYWHVLMTRLFDKHGLCSKWSTYRLIKKIEKINPDIIHLHQIHGYFLNYEILFDYLKKSQKPVVWTMHDCWAITGHCAHFVMENCNKWQTGCYKCINKKKYPNSIFKDNSKENYIRKKNAFTSLSSLYVVPVSYWLGDLMKQSFLKPYPIKVIHNGIDINTFRPRDIEREALGLSNDFLILGVSFIWSDSKGLNDFFLLRKKLPMNYKILLIGLTDKQIELLPEGIIGIKKTHNVEELAKYYSTANVFVNLTKCDTYPTVNLEAMACGTPVITYKTGGSPECISDNNGYVAEQGKIDEVIDYIKKIQNENSMDLKSICRSYAEKHFDKKKSFANYLSLYKELLNQNTKVD